MIKTFMAFLSGTSTMFSDGNNRLNKPMSVSLSNLYVDFNNFIDVGGIVL